MAKDNRLYGRFTLDFADNYKVLPLSDAAFRCLVEATLWCRKEMNDGALARRYAVARWGLDVLQELTTNDAENPSLIEVDNGWVIHHFAEHQDTRAEIEARSARNKLAGQKGGLAKGKRDAKRPASELVSESLPETETETETYKRKDLSDADAPDVHPIATAYPKSFEEFWTEYPRKDDKRSALAAWKRAKKRANERELIDGAIRYTQDPNRKPQFTKQATRWLNGDCWLSDAVPSNEAGPQLDWSQV